MHYDNNERKLNFMDRTTATNFTVLFMFLNLLFWTLVWEPVANTLHMPTLFQLAFFQVLLFIIPCGLYLFFTKSSPKLVLRIHNISFKNIILIIFIAITIQPAMTMLSFLSSFLFKNNVSATLYANSDSNLFLLLISVAVVPAICEELFFRGIVFYNFHNLRLGKACFVTGLYFSFMHMDLQQILYTFAIGTFFCFLVYRTNSIYSSILAHFVINASQTIYSALMLKLEKQGILYNIQTLLAPKGELYSIMMLFLFSIPFFVGFLWLFCKNNIPQSIPTEEGFPEYHPNRKCKETPYDVFFYSVIGIYIAVTVIPLFK